VETSTELLNFRFFQGKFEQLLKVSFPSERLIENRIRRLSIIEEQVGNEPFKNSSKDLILIPQVYNKTKQIIKTGGILSLALNRRELRTLTYSLSYPESNKDSIFNNEQELDIVFSALEASWKDSYLIGLIDCYLRNWGSDKRGSSEKLWNFILTKFQKYEGGRKLLNSIKENLRFFDLKNGDKLLISQLFLSNEKISNAAKFLSLPKPWFSYSYFSKVIASYYEERKRDIPKFFDELEFALEEHNNSYSNLRIVSKLIIQANSSDYSDLQDKVKTLALKLFGDPSHSSQWVPAENLTEDENQQLIQARKILGEWITRQFINVFFEKCINDHRRKRFWLKYVQEITQFRVVGSSYIRRVLMSDNRISEIVSPRFSKTNSLNDRNAALIFKMKDYLFIEFSDEGAFYAYKSSNPKAPSIDRKSFERTDDLKLTHYRQLVYRSGTVPTEVNEEGSLPHRDGVADWEDVADYWLKNKAGIYV
jgi:hypothetical protein